MPPPHCGPFPCRLRRKPAGPPQTPRAARRTLVLALTLALAFLPSLATPFLGAGAAAPAVPTPNLNPTASAARTEPRALGEVMVRIAAAWPTVRSLRTLTTYPPTDTGPATPTAADRAADVAAEEAELVDEYVFPDRRRRILRSGGEPRAEAVAIAGRLWLRGPQVTESAAAAPVPLPASPPLIVTIADYPWVEVDVAALDRDDAEELGLALLADPLDRRPPLAGLPLTARFAPLTPLAAVVVGDRTCPAYRATVEDPAALLDPNRADEPFGRVELTVALGTDDLPCLIEERGDRFVVRTEFTAYNPPLAIAPPRP